MPFPYKHANGGTCCSQQKYCCASCAAKLADEGLPISAEHRAFLERVWLRAAEDKTPNYAPPDPYAAALAAQRKREAKSTPEKAFEDAYKAERTRQFDAELQRAKERTTR